MDVGGNQHLKCKESNFVQGHQEDGWGPGANTKSGAHNVDCVREVWGTTPEYFEVLHALKYALGASEARMHTVHTVRRMGP